MDYFVYVYFPGLLSAIRGVLDDAQRAKLIDLNGLVTVFADLNNKVLMDHECVMQSTVTFASY